MLVRSVLVTLWVDLCWLVWLCWGGVFFSSSGGSRFGVCVGYCSADLGVLGGLLVEFGLGGVVKLVFVVWCWCCEFVVTEVVAFLGFGFYCAWWFWVCVGVQFV